MSPFAKYSAAMSEENVEKVRRGYEAFNRRDWDAAFADFDDSVVWRPLVSVETDELRGKDAVRESWLSSVESLDIRIEIHELIPVGADKVLAVATWTGRGSAGDIPVVATAAQIFTLRDGRLVRVESYTDRREALEAAGLSA